MHKRIVWMLVLLSAGLAALPGQQILDVPESPSTSILRHQLAYAESFDEVAQMDYAYLAYLERDRNSDEWSVIILGNRTGGTTYRPSHPVFARKCGEAARSGEPYWVHGFSMSPRPGDARTVEHRLYVDPLGNPTHLELFLVTRDSDGRPKEPVIARAPWPDLP